MPLWNVPEPGPGRAGGCDGGESSGRASQGGYPVLRYMVHTWFLTLYVFRIEDFVRFLLYLQRERECEKIYLLYGQNV